MKVGDRVDKYLLLKELGHGGMGGVWIAFDPDNDDLVAVKTVFEELARDEIVTRRFQREIDVLAKLDHPNIVGYRGSGRTERTVYVALEHIRGADLADLIRDQKRFSVPDVIHIICGVSRALQHAHEKGVVHRDIKPSNIMVTHESRIPKILDFGVAHAEDGAFHTATGDIVGTFMYAAPEQNQGKQVDERSDLYALGLLFYELLTGQRALTGSTHQEVTTAQLTGAFAPPSQRYSGAPPELDPIVLKLLELNPDDRFQSAEELLFDLEMYQNDPSTLGEERRSIYEYPEFVGDFKKGQAFLRNGDTEEALQIVETLVAQAPRAAELYALKGEVEQARGAGFAAINDLKRAITFDRGNIAYQLQLGEVYEGMGMEGLAKEVYTDVLEIEPNSTVARERLDKLTGVRDTLRDTGGFGSVASSNAELNQRVMEQRQQMRRSLHDGQMQTLSQEDLEPRPSEETEEVSPPPPPPAQDEAARARLAAFLEERLPEPLSPAGAAVGSAILWPFGFFRLGATRMAAAALVAQVLVLAGIGYGLSDPFWVPPELLGQRLQEWAAANPGQSAVWLYRICGLLHLVGSLWISMDVYQAIRFRNLQAYVVEVDLAEGTLVLNAGKSRGFRKGDRLLIYLEREAGSGVGTMIGEAELIELHPDHSVGRYHSGSERAPSVGAFAVPGSAVNEGWVDPGKADPDRFPDLGAVAAA